MREFVTSKTFGWLGLLVILLISAAVYSPSLDVPFYLDDTSSIETRIHEFKQQPLKSLWTDEERRSLSYSTFWLDTRIHGASIEGFHTTNVLIHLLTSIAIFLFIKSLVNVIKPGTNATLWALAVTAIWALHPLNSQAVIYIVQRMTSLATLFSVLSVLCWLKWRITEGSGRFGWLLMAFVAFVASWHSKETAVVIPLIWLSIDAIRPKQSLKGWAVLLLFVIALAALVLPLVNGLYPDVMQQLNQASRQTHYFGRLEYFWAQQEILFSYLWRWFWPQELLLYYPYFEGGSANQHFGYFIGHLALLSVAVMARKKLPLLAFGIFVFYAGHALESSFLPIKDIAFEHRNYLPTLGLAIATVSLLYLALEKIKVKSGLTLGSVTALLAIVLALLTYQRTLEWQQPARFYENEYKVSEQNPDAKVVWAIELSKQGEYKQAELLLKDVIDYYQQHNYMNVTAADNYLRAIQAQGGYYESIGPAIKMLAKIKQPHARSQLLTTLAIAYVELDGCEMATGFLKTAQKLDPSNQRAKEYAKKCNVVIGN